MEYDIRVHNERSRPLVVVRRTARLNELSKVVPDACGTVWSVVRGQQVPEPGRLVAVYLDDQINLEVGIELAAQFAGHGEVFRSSTPEGLVATTTHFGPYEKLHQAHESIRLWCGSNGHRLTGPNWEVYAHWEAEWNREPSRIRTDVFYLIAAVEGSTVETAAATGQGG